jgi:hypothetical protein
MAYIASEPCTEAKLREPELAEFAAELARQHAVFKPLRNVRENASAHVRAYAFADEAFLVGEEGRNIEHVDGIGGARRRCRAPGRAHRLRTRASLS